jgi:hypothetical protein
MEGNGSSCKKRGSQNDGYEHVSSGIYRRVVR